MWRKVIASVIAVLMMVIGGIWTAKANGWIGEAEPSRSFAMLGAGMLGLGVALLYVVWQSGRQSRR
jgi:hypothetical protein